MCGDNVMPAGDLCPHGDARLQWPNLEIYSPDFHFGIIAKLIGSKEIQLLHIPTIVSSQSVDGGLR